MNYLFLSSMWYYFVIHNISHYLNFVEGPLGRYSFQNRFYFYIYNVYILYGKYHQCVSCIGLHGLTAKTTQLLYSHNSKIQLIHYVKDKMRQSLNN